MKINQTRKNLVPMLVCGLGLGLATTISLHADGGGRHRSLDINLTLLGVHASGPPFNTSAAEIVAHDPCTQRLYVDNAQGARIDVLDIQDPTTPTKIGMIDLLSYGAVVNSVAVHDGLIAVAVEAAVKTNPGHAVFFDHHLHHLKTIQVGALPDMIKFSPNGR